MNLVIMPKDSALCSFKRLRTHANPGDLARFPENASLVVDLFSRFKLGLVVDAQGKVLSVDGATEWIAIGARGQLWEYGPGKLGFTVEGPKRVRCIIRQLGDIAHASQLGDNEANFVCDWTPENLRRVAKALRLHRRHAPASKVPAQNCTESQPPSHATALEASLS